MPANPHQCRLYASRFFALAKNARSREARQIFAGMAETWNRLAAEAESDQTLLQGEPNRSDPDLIKQSTSCQLNVEPPTWPSSTTTSLLPAGGL